MSPLEWGRGPDRGVAVAIDGGFADLHGLGDFVDNYAFLKELGHCPALLFAESLQAIVDLLSECGGRVLVETGEVLADMEGASEGSFGQAAFVPGLQHI